MTDHIPEWKKIKTRYENTEQTNEIKFRIECIDDLIESAENKQKELNHFR